MSESKFSVTEQGFRERFVERHPYFLTLAVKPLVLGGDTFQHEGVQNYYC